MSQCKVQIVYLGPSLSRLSAAGRVLICVGIRTPRKNSLLVDQIPDVQWVILIILDLNLTSSDAWQLDRHRDELMFQSGSWRMSPLSPTSRL